ncbi:MAG: endonuclease III [Rikenellaceae bacterium]
MTKKERYEGISKWFAMENPNADTELHYTTTWSLLVAVMLSAQCTDKRVNMVTPSLMARYPSPVAMASSSAEEIFGYIRSISYPNSKASHLFTTSQILCRDFGGEVPSSRAGLESLAGVGRKTANVMLSVAFGEVAMAVDTHVFRVSRRIGLSRGTTPEAVERDLLRGFRGADMARAHHWLILHGRYVCLARTPRCGDCGISGFCKHFSSCSAR